MNKYYNPYIRLQTYYSLLSNSISKPIDEHFDYGLSIARLHEIMHIPINIIRKDLFCLFKQNNILYINDEDYNYIQLNNEINIEKLFYEDTNIKSIKKMFISGILDYIPFYVINNNYQLNLTFSQREALYHFIPDLKNPFNGYEKTYYIKDSYKFYVHNQTVFAQLEVINSAMDKNLAIKIEYKNAKEQTSVFTIKPLKIAYNSQEDSYALLSIYEDKIMTYPLDRIQFIEFSKTIINTDDSLINKIAPYVWGNSFSDNPIKVKVKFYNEANVFRKVKRDLSYRKGKLYEKNNFLYYEDTVYGFNSFKKWILGYGSSAIVISPLKLREEIINSLKSRKQE